MDFNEIMKLLAEVPIFVWVVLFFVVSFLSADRKTWEHEIDFRYKEGIGSGEVEIENYKRKGSIIEVEMKLEEPYRNKAVEVFINDQLVCTMPANKNDGSGFDYEEKYQFDEPKSGDRVDIKIENKTIFSDLFR